MKTTLSLLLFKVFDVVFYEPSMERAARKFVLLQMFEKV